MRRRALINSIPRLRVGPAAPLTSDADRRMSATAVLTSATSAAVAVHIDALAAWATSVEPEPSQVAAKLLETRGRLRRAAGLRRSA